MNIALSAQIVKGTVAIYQSEEIGLNQVNITNLNTRNTVRADVDGNFTILALSGNTLRFSSYYTERLDIQVDSPNFNQGKTVMLNLPIHVMKEVRLTGVKLTGNLNQDLQKLEKSSKAQAIKKMVGLPEPKTPDYTDLPSVLSIGDMKGPPGIGLNLESLYDVLSGERKKKLRAAKYFTMQKDITRVRQFMGDEYFTSKKIPENLINDFLQFVYTSENGSLIPNPERLGSSQSLIEKYLPIFWKRVEHATSYNTMQKNGQK